MSSNALTQTDTRIPSWYRSQALLRWLWKDVAAQLMHTCTLYRWTPNRYFPSDSISEIHLRAYRDPKCPPPVSSCPCQRSRIFYAVGMLMQQHAVEVSHTKTCHHPRPLESKMRTNRVRLVAGGFTWPSGGRVASWFKYKFGPYSFLPGHPPARPPTSGWLGIRPINGHWVWGSVCTAR